MSRLPSSARLRSDMSSPDHADRLDMTKPADAPANPQIQEQVRNLHALAADLAADPVMRLMQAPESVRVIFPYGDGELVLLARSPEALARVGRTLRITRSRRHGRSGHRIWANSLRNPAQMPKPAVPTKTR